MKKLLLVLCLCMIPTICSAGYDYESITVAYVAISPTAAKVNISRTSEADCILETASIRIRVDGVAPTASEGLLLQPGTAIITFPHEDLVGLKMIRTGGTSGVMKCSYR